MPDMDAVVNRMETICNICKENTWRTEFSSDIIYPLLRDAIAILKEQDEQKRKWLQTIADTQLAISPTGYESEDELAKRGWEWNGLQMAWEIIAGEERSEHPRLVRCKDCKHKEASVSPYWEAWCSRLHCGCDSDWFCADGERRVKLE